MRTEISSELRPSINGAPIESALAVPELYELLGNPSRVVKPEKPAPVGHKK
jgi:hypothetical protein